MIHISFTGSQRGMSLPARKTLSGVLQCLYDVSTFGSEPICFHHGDCIGCDLIASEVAKKAGYLVHAHPSFIESKRAFSEYNDIIHAPKDPIKRNEDLAKVCTTLVATPHTYHEIIRSGTWTTIRRARALKRQICIIFPDGSEKWENGEHPHPDDRKAA